MVALRLGATKLRHEDFVEGISQVISKKKAALNYYALIANPPYPHNNNLDNILYSLIYSTALAQAQSFSAYNSTILALSCHIQPVFPWLNQRTMIAD